MSIKATVQRKMLMSDCRKHHLAFSVVSTFFLLKSFLIISFSIIEKNQFVAPPASQIFDAFLRIESKRKDIEPTNLNLRKYNMQCERNSFWYSIWKIPDLNSSINSWKLLSTYECILIIEFQFSMQAAIIITLPNASCYASSIIIE